MSLTANFDYCVELGLGPVKAIFHLALKNEELFPHNVGPFVRDFSGLQFTINARLLDDIDNPADLEFADEKHIRFFIPFAVSPPPAQPGQIATDWSRVAIDVTRPASPEMPEIANAFHLLLPVVPAGSSGTLRFRVKSPIFLEPEDPGVPPFIDVAADIRAPYFQPDLPEDVVAFYVSQAKQYAVSAHGTTTFPSDAAIAAYVRTQLAGVVTNGRLAAVTNGIGNLPVYSQTQLIIDTGQFIAGESETASATFGDRGWLARIVSQLVAGPAEARLNDPCAGVNDAVEYINCEQETNPCKHGCPDDAPLTPPPLPCEGTIKKILDFLGIPCKPKPERVPFHVPRDPNYKAGSGGPGGFIDGVTPINYTVTFENVATASGDAFEVKVTDQLDVSKYDLATFSLGPISFANKFVPDDLREAYASVSQMALAGVRHCYERAGTVATLRLHGDCHASNVLWTEGGPHFVDFDDARMGPAVQDLWMLLSGDRESMTQQIGDVLDGYEDFADFDRAELHLVEALRTLRLMHYSAWIARRWDDPAFPAAFPWFNTQRYWQDRILELREQVAAMQEPPLVA